MVDLRVVTFFDKPAIRHRVDYAKRRALSRVGAFVRQRARSSLRRRKGYSQPGNPPNLHHGGLKQIVFAWDPAVESVVIGPMMFTGRTARREDVPGLLEHGGTVLRERLGEWEYYHYEPRPYMRPALDAEIAAGTIPAAFRNSVRSGF